MTKRLGNQQIDNKFNVLRKHEKKCEKKARNKSCLHRCGKKKKKEKYFIKNKETNEMFHTYVPYV